jgi:hypothetical protein
MLQQSKLASAVAVAIGASVVALGTAQAGTILFPQIAVSPTITTIVSVMNAGDGYELANGTETLHYAYYYKEWLDSSYNEDICVERNRYLPTSKNDIQTMDIGDVAFGSAGRGVMFNDPSVNNNWDVGAAAQNYALGANLPGAPAAHRAYLLVDNDSEAGWGPDLAGEAILMDVANGASWGYQAFQNSASNDDDFLDYASFRYSLVAYMPPAEVTTKFLATVLDDDMGGAATYNQRTHLGVRVLDPFGGTVPGAFDRDENFFSGGVDRPVVCVGGWNIQDLYPDAFATTPAGGWTNVTNYYVDPDGKNPDEGTQNAAVFKVEFGDMVDGVATGGVFNNGLYLHPSR